MRLYSIDYTEYADHPYKWSLADLTLININLIVGRNAVGKSRILRIINGLARLIDGSLLPANLATGYYKATFRDETKSRHPDITYELEIYDKKVTKEVLTVGDVVKLNRKDSGRGSIYFVEQKDFIDIQVPENNLAIAARRDARQHTFFEELHQWANTVQYYQFAKASQDHVSVIDKNIKWGMINALQIDQAFHVLVKLGKEKYNRDLISPVVSNMRKIGYEITDFGLMPITGLPNTFTSSGIPQALYVKEVGIEKKLEQKELSAGMFRALVTLIQLQMIQLEKKPSCVLIDDLGEGLDFDRATKLISIVIQQAETGYSQFLLTTNDRFVMNKVPLEYWCVIERDAGKVKAYTPRNSPETFKEFEEYGFNNFDFFAKGFFAKSIKDAAK